MDDGRVFVEHVLQELDQLIEKKSLLKNPFYRAWSEGKLSLPILQEYAKEYSHHVNAFPTYLSALHSRSGKEIRRILLKNLVEEEGGEPNHPDLWQKFALACGATLDDLSMHQPSSAVQALIQHFISMCQTGAIAAAIACLYAYESQIPEICIAKITGLRRFYGFHDPKSWEYFTVHIEADRLHAAEERTLLAQHVHEKNSQEVFDQVEKTLSLLHNFLLDLCQRYGLPCQVA